MDFHYHDLATIGLLIFLEGVLSIDNALALAVIARKVPKHLQQKALTYGLVGAIVFRFISLGLAAYLMRWTWVKFIGGGYLLWVALSHWFLHKEEDHENSTKSHAMTFWKTVVVIELTDLAFAVDSILAAVAVTNKYWVVVTGGVIGLIMMRFAAKAFIQLLNRFPNFESTAYLLVFTIGAKLVVDGFKFDGVNFHSPSSPAFWLFWIVVVTCIAYGFVPKRQNKATSEKIKALQAQERAVENIENG